MSDTIDLASLRCACGALPVLVDPGEPEEISLASDIVVRRGRPITGRCLGCWPAAMGCQQTLFGEPTA